MTLLRRPDEPGARWIAVTCAAVAVWCVGNTIQINSTSYDVKRFTVTLAFACSATAVYSLWRGVIQRTDWPRPVPISVARLAALPAVVTCTLVATTDAPGPFFRTLTIPDGPGPVTGSAAGMHAFHQAWSNVLVVWALAGIGYIVWRVPRQRFAVVATSVLAFAVPPLVNVVWVATDLRLLDGNDPTPISTLPGAVVLFVALRRSSRLSVDVGLLPIAQDTVVESMSDGVVVIDGPGRVVDINPAAADMLALDASATIGRDARDVIPGWRDDEIERAWEFPAADETSPRTISVRVGDVGEGSAGRVALLRDVSEQHAARAALELSLARQEHAARHDPLTGLPNRTAVFWTLRTALADEAPITLLIVGLDGFKSLNDAFGHRHGDRVLCEVAARLRRTLPRDTTVARLGGDEYAMVMAGAEPDAAARTARQVLNAISEPFSVEGAEVSVGARIGVALGPLHGGDADALVHAADVAMHCARRSSTRWTVYESSLDRRRPERVVLRHDLRRAIANGELEVQYQPQATPGREVAAMEALVRWRHPDRGLLAPGTFLPACEGDDLLCRLTDVVFDLALSDLEELGAAFPGLAVSMNLSACDIRDSTLADRLAAAIATHDADPHRITVEVTENALVEAGDGLDALSAVRDLGIRVSLDDFGTGSGPLATLRELPVDELKIDRSFVAGLGRPRETALVAGLIRLAHDLELTVVAEGVESADQAVALGEMGCDLLQGFHIGGPAPLRSAADSSAVFTPVRRFRRSSPTRSEQPTTTGTGHADEPSAWLEVQDYQV